MVRQSRLRVQKSKINRRVLFLVLFISAVVLTSWQVNKKYQIVTHISEIISKTKENPAADVIPRGTIYDRNLKQVAVTLARVSVYVRIKEIKSITETVRELAAILPVDSTGLQKILEAGSLRVWVAEDINQEQEDAIKKRKLPGVYLQREQARFYPNKASAAHLIGYVDNNIGLAGVEFYYDRLLAGRQVEGQAESSHLNYSQDLVLTVDLKIQKVLEDLVEDIAKKQDITRVAAYVMEGVTGEIVGGAQYPGFNPNNFTKFSPDVLENIFLKQTIIPDKFRVLLRDASHIFSNTKKSKTLLPWPVQVFDTDLGSQLRLWEWLGLTEQWSTDFSAYNHTEQERQTDYRPFPHPQEKSYELVPEYATPLKILTAMAGIFGSGNKIRPHVVDSVLDAETGKEYGLDENTFKDQDFTVITEAGAKEVEWLLRSQARADSSGALFFRDKDLIVKPSESGQRFLSSEMLFVIIPADTSTLKMLVVAEGQPALPLIRERRENTFLEKRVGQIVDRISVLQQVAKTVADVLEIEKRGEGNYPLKKQVDLPLPGSSEVPSNGKEETGKMPDLVGLSLRRSLQLLQNHNLKIRFQGTGRVVSQQPPPGTSLNGISECSLMLERLEDMKVEKMIETEP